MSKCPYQVQGTLTMSHLNSDEVSGHRASTPLVENMLP